MSSKSPLLLVLLGLVLAAGVGFLILGDGGTETLAVTATDHSVALPVGHTAPELSKPETVAVARDEAPAPKVEASAKPEQERVSHSNSIWVEGRVVFPNQTPADEQVTVIAVGKKFKGKKTDPKEYSAQVEPSGRFRVAFADGTRRGRLKLSGKYVYLESSLKLLMASLPDEVLLEPKLGGCIEVTLVPPTQAAFSGEELESIRVSADLWSSSEPHVNSEAEMLEGEVYRMGGLRPAPDYHVSLESNRFQDHSEGDVGVRVGEVKTLEFTLEFGARVAGVVVDEEEQPVKAAEVEFHLENSWESIYTDSEGKFEQGGLSVGELTITVSKAGYEPHTLDEMELLAVTDIDDLKIVLGKGNSIFGLVTWPDGKPVSGAKVVLEQEEREDDNFTFGESYDGTATTDADGKFTITGLEASECSLTARAQPVLVALEDESNIRLKRRQKREPYWHAIAEDVIPGKGLVTLVLRQGDGVRGIVVDDLGQPLEDYRIVAIPGGGDPWNRPTIGRVTLKVQDSEDGAFELEGLKEGLFELDVSAKGYSSLGDESVEIPWNGTPLKIVMSRDATVTGLVRDAAGVPLHGARVELDHTNDSGPFSFMSSTRSDTTEEDGTFEFKFVAPGEISITAEADGFASSSAHTTTLLPAEERTGIELTMRTGAAIVGQIHASVGKLADVEVTVRGGDLDAWEQTTTDASGAFEIEGLSPGEYQVWFEPDMSDQNKDEDSYWVVRQARERRETVQLIEGERAQVILGAPFSTPILVSGRVTSGGQPKADQLITIRQLGDRSERQFNGVARTDATGTYSVTLGGAGRYQFSIGEGWGRSLTTIHDIPNEESVRLDFALPTGSVSGVVRGPGGEALAEMHVSIEYASKDENEDENVDTDWSGNRAVETDEEGRFEFDNVRAGAYILRVSESNYGWGNNNKRKYATALIADVLVEEGKTTQQPAIHMRPSGKVKGIVRTAAGTPAANVFVQAKNADGLNFDMWITSSTDGTGRFTIDGLPAGKVIVHAWSREEQVGEVPAQVFEGGTSEVELVID